jgi:hypothetical protein
MGRRSNHVCKKVSKVFVREKISNFREFKSDFVNAVIVSGTRYINLLKSLPFQRLS